MGRIQQIVKTSDTTPTRDGWDVACHWCVRLLRLLFCVDTDHAVILLRIVFAQFTNTMPSSANVKDLLGVEEKVEAPTPIAPADAILTAPVPGVPARLFGLGAAFPPRRHRFCDICC